MFGKIASPDYKIKYPKGIDKAGKSLIRHLLVRDVNQRYGCMKNGVKDIKSHRFFKDIDWEALEQRQIETPFIPTIESPEDTKNYMRYSEEESNTTSMKCPPVEPGEDPFLSW